MICPARLAKIFPCAFRPNHFYNPRHPVPGEGRIAIVTDVGRDAVDADGVGRVKRWQGGFPVSDSQSALTNDAVADGEVVWS